MKYQLVFSVFHLLISCFLIFLTGPPLQAEGTSLFNVFRPNSARHRVYPRSSSTHLELTQASEKARTLWNEIEAKSQMNPCWKRSVEALRSDCATIRAESALRTRLALGMAACDSESDDRGGASSFYCTPQQNPHKCVKGLSEPAYAIFIQYRLHTDVLCAFLQEELFQQRTEAAVIALESAAELSIDSLKNLQYSSVKLLRTAEETMEAHQDSKRLSVELHKGLQRLQDSQNNTMQGLHISADSILRTSNHTKESLLYIQKLLNSVAVNASYKLDELATQAAEHYASMDQRTSKIFQLLRYIEKAHTNLIRHAISLQAALQYVLVVTLILCTTMPRRTAAARLPALGCLAAGLFAGVLTKGGPLGQIPWIIITSGAATMIIGYVGCTYVSVECLQRQIIHDEVMQIVKKSQMDLMAWIEAKDFLPSPYSTALSAATTAPMSSLLHQVPHSFLSWGRPPEGFIPSPINIIPLPRPVVSSNCDDDKRYNRNKEVHPERTILEIDVEESQKSSPEVTIPKKPPKIPAMKRPRAKNIDSPLDNPIGTPKSKQSTHQHRRRIEE